MIVTKQILDCIFDAASELKLSNKEASFNSSYLITLFKFAAHNLTHII
jgi:hypothetical protein